MLYILGLLIIFLLGYCKRLNDKAFLFCSAVMILLIMSLRGSTVGTDSASYLSLFRSIAAGEITSLHAKAPLFVFIMKVVSKAFGTSNQVYFGTTALLVVIPLWIAISLSGVSVRNAVITYYLLFFQSSLNTTRTYISVSFVMLAYVLARKKKMRTIVESVLFLTIAFFIHRIALIGIPIVAVSFLDLTKKKNRQIIMMLTAVCCLCLGAFINLFVKIFKVYASTLGSVKDTVGASAMVFQLLIIITLCHVFYLLRKRRDSAGVISREDYDNMAVVLFAEVMLFIAGGTTWYVQRVLTYLEMFTVFLFPVVDRTKNKYRMIYRIIFIVFSFFLFFYGIGRNLSDVRPYVFFWEAKSIV